MALRDLIHSHGLTGTASEITAALNATTQTWSCSDKITYATLADQFGKEAVTGFDATLKSLGLEWVRLTLSGAGLDFSNEKTQATIDELLAGGAIDKTTAQSLKTLGIKPISPYEAWAGLGQVATEEQVAAALVPPVVQGHAVQAACHVGPDRTSVAVSVVEIVDGVPGRVVSAMGAQSATDAHLTETQRAFVAALLALVGSYGG